MIIMAHHLSNIADLTGQMQSRNEAFETIDAAIVFFEKVISIFFLCKKHNKIINGGE